MLPEQRFEAFVCKRLLCFLKVAQHELSHSNVIFDFLECKYSVFEALIDVGLGLGSVQPFQAVGLLLQPVALHEVVQRLLVVLEIEVVHALVEIVVGMCKYIPITLFG